MRIGICGSFSTGKTTLLESLKNTKEFENYKVDISHERILYNHGFSVGKQGSIEFQNILLYKELYNLNVYKNYITDSPLPLCQAYSDFYKKYDTSDYVAYHLLCMHIASSIKNYDFFVYTGLDVSLEEDGIRDSDNKFREEVDIILRKYLKSLNITVLYLKEGIEQRINEVLKYYRT